MDNKWFEGLRRDPSWDDLFIKTCTTSNHRARPRLSSKGILGKGRRGEQTVVWLVEDLTKVSVQPFLVFDPVPITGDKDTVSLLSSSRNATLS